MESSACQGVGQQTHWEGHTLVFPSSPSLCPSSLAPGRADGSLPPLLPCLACVSRQGDLYLENNFCPHMSKCSQIVLALSASLSSHSVLGALRQFPPRQNVFVVKQKEHFWKTIYCKFCFSPPLVPKTKKRRSRRRWSVGAVDFLTFWLKL